VGVLGISLRVRRICVVQRWRGGLECEEQDMTEQDYLYQQIDRIGLEYEKAIKPYVDRLVYLKRIESPPSILVTQEQYAAMIQERNKT
jgi:hypothetical protein